MAKMKGNTVAGVKGNKTTPKMATVKVTHKSPIKGTEKKVKQYHATRGIVKFSHHKI